MIVSHYALRTFWLQLVEWLGLSVAWTETGKKVVPRLQALHLWQIERKTCLLGPTPGKQGLQGPVCFRPSLLPWQTRTFPGSVLLLQGWVLELIQGTGIEMKECLSFS
jgi:hypothetical protein